MAALGQRSGKRSQVGGLRSEVKGQKSSQRSSQVGTAVGHRSSQTLQVGTAVGQRSKVRYQRSEVGSKIKSEVAFKDKSIRKQSSCASKRC